MVLSVAPYNAQVFYTGIDSQPDNLVLFVKNREGNASYACQVREAPANTVGKFVPILGSVCGVVRIVNAVKAIFEKLSKKNLSEPKPLWNSFKNLFRGLVETCPGSGIFLIIFDAVRNSISVRITIEKGVQEDNMLGIAADGKVLVTFPIHKMDEKMPEVSFDNQSRLHFMSEFMRKYLESTVKAQGKPTASHLSLTFSNYMNSN